MSLLPKLTLQKRIGLFFLAGMAIGLGLFSWVAVQLVNESVERTLDERLTIARMVASHLDKTLTYALVQLQNAADFNEGLPTDEQFASVANSLLDTLVRSGIPTKNIILIDRDGRVVWVEPENPVLIGTDLSGYPEVKGTLEAGLSTISGFISSPSMEVPVVLISVPISNEEGEIIGVLSSLIKIEQSGIGAFSPAITVGETGYTEIVDKNGIVLARTSPGAPPERLEKSDHPGRFAELISQGKATVGTCHRCHEAGEEIQRRRDVLAFAPLSTASWGVAIRQSEEEALAPARQLETRFLLLGLTVLAGAFLLVWMMMRRIVNPIRMLTSATKKVASGDFKAAIPVKRQDEIGELSTAFHTMTQELAKSRDELLLRSEYLSALNSIAVTVSQSLNLEEVLENAMQKVLEVTRTTAGCVFLRSSDGNKLEKMSCIGSSYVFSCQESGSSVASCACHQVLRNGEILMVNDVSQCPMMGEKMVVKEDIGCFVSVPLKSKDRTIGVMNIACSNERCFTENDFRILDSIGYYVGLAVENSVLYEEAKQKEKLRGQLLSSVISAQEEERKRIARELHDEYGQTLAGLMMNIETVENMIPSKQTQIKEKLGNAKAIVVRALEDLRRLTLDLRPSALDDLGLIAAIRTYAQAKLEDVGVQVEFESKGLGKRLSPTIETALFRIIQEAIYNITKYAEAHNVWIQLEVSGGKIKVTVKDDGKGFDVDAVFKSRTEAQSLGLLGIQERVALLSGTFTIESQVGQGTCLMIEIPIADLSDKARSGQNQVA